MQTTTYSHARQNFASIIDECCNNHEPILITRSKHKGEAVLMSKEDYSSWMETIHILETHDLKRLFESIDQANRGQVTTRELLDD